MMRYGIPFSPMVFIPFMGAAVAMKNAPKDAMQDAVIAFGGPALGTVGAMGVAAAAQMNDSQLLYALADFGYMVNLINMIPLGQLDGGKIAGACSPYAGVAGLGIGGGLLYTGIIGNPIFLAFCSIISYDETSFPSMASIGLLARILSAIASFPAGKG